MLARILRRETRRAPRVAVSASSKLRYSAQHSASVKIENLSAYGLRGSGDCPLKRGDWVSIEIAELGPIVARIAWTKDERFGAIFSREVRIDPLVRKTRSLFERLPGLPVASWDFDLEDDKPEWPVEPRGPSDAERARLDRIARATEQAEQYIREMKEKRDAASDRGVPSIS